ncbi:hypothetical protein ABZ616_13925 [Streptomyces noursei]|uniref:Uncharacterized protein n=1 Tax=Streptomyces mashuensis TaxID=33904 RepID=A0A919B7Y0_9ACTN|nr:hypothetical protein [Streptomyces mashuensis]GHF61716.1 hypothetical protein GCM10010218_49080 [Streptomyces mashuensis]
MITQQDAFDAEIDAWVADQLAASPDWTPEHYARVWAYLEPSETQLGEAA